MNLYLTKISRSYVKGVMRYQGGPDPPVSDVVPKPLVSEGLMSRFIRKSEIAIENSRDSI